MAHWSKQLSSQQQTTEQDPICIEPWELKDASLQEKSMQANIWEMKAGKNSLNFVANHKIILPI